MDVSTGTTQLLSGIHLESGYPRSYSLEINPESCHGLSHRLESKDASTATLWSSIQRVAADVEFAVASVAALLKF